MMPRSKSLEKTIRQMQPLIIIGMHRSGTSLTVRLLKDLGIHIGNRLSRDAEAIYFQLINRRIYNSVGSKWNDINAIQKAMHSEQFIQEQADRVLDVLFPTHSINPRAGIVEYFGPHLWKALSQGKTIDWAWKDPRTTFTFPIWLRVFPQARFLHVVRNGIDVAISTHRRTHKQRRNLLKRVLRFDYSPLTLDFIYCFHLWEEYISFVIENKGIISSNRYLELRYENLLAKPEEALRQITNFMEYPIKEDLLYAACTQINQERLYNSKNAKPYQDVIPALADRPIMQSLGYSYGDAEGIADAKNEH